MATIRKIGLIDLGTNSVRFDVHQILPRGESRLIHREKVMVRLGENLFVSGRLEQDAVARTLETLREFQTVARKLSVDKMVAFATSAVRDASDGPQFCARVKKEVGLDIEVISGQEEARWIAAGVLAHRKKKKTDFALVDIGGGSTEISLCVAGDVVRSESLPLGVARIQQVFLKTVPPTPTALVAARSYIREQLAKSLKGWPVAKRIVGSSGTVRTLLKIALEENEGKLSPKFLARLGGEMESMSPEMLETIPGMDPKRRDLILAGVLVLEETMRQLGARRAFATKFSLRDGMLEKMKATLAPPQAKPLS